MSRLRVGLELTVLELDGGGTARAARALAEGLRARRDVELVTFAHGGPLRGTTPGEGEGDGGRDALASGSAPAGTHGSAPPGLHGSAPPGPHGSAPADASGSAPAGASGSAPAGTHGSAPAAAREAARRAARGLARELAWLPLELPRRVRRARLDVLHCPSPLVPIGPGSTPLVVTVHDLLAWEHPEWMSRANVLQHRLVLQRVLPRAAVVVTSSRFTRGALLQRFGLAPERVLVVPLAVDPIFTPGSGGVAGVTGPYLVAVGTLQPRKDLEVALAAFERCADAGAPHALVVAGGHGWRDAATLARLRASPYAARIHVLGRVDDTALVRALRGADALLFASRHEGFGLPPLEAMACGTPVVAVRATAVPEVVGDGAVLVEPADPDAFARAVAALLEDPTRQADLRERGLRRAREFTQARTTELTVAAYRRARSLT